MKTHICLVSQQAAANLLPALDPELKPEKVILVVSKIMKQQAQNLAAVFGEAGIKPELFELSDEHDLATTENELLELASQRTDDGIFLNITGGTKLMSLAAQSIAAEAKWQMFYVDADTDQISWLDRNRAPHRLSEQLRLSHYLRSYGFKFANTKATLQVTHKQQDLTKTLITQIGSLEQPLAMLNWLAQQAENAKSLDSPMDEVQRDSRSLDALLRNFDEAGCLTVKDDTIHFSSEADRNFVKGGWLEVHVYRTVCSMANDVGIIDQGANLEVIDERGVKNELDVLFMARNRLFVIECKTARMDQPKISKANDTLFKLAENSRRIGGLGTRGMLVSYRSLRDHEKQLARALNIKLVCGVEIQRLTEHLKTWIAPRS